MLALLLAAALTAPPTEAAASVAMPRGPGTVAVALADPDADDQPFADAVGQALGERDFVTLPTPGHSRYIAQVSIARRRSGIVATRVPREHASTGIGSWGPVVRVPLGSHKTQLDDLVLTTLTVRLLDRADRRQVWSGSAVTAQVEGAPVAGKLARAAVAAFPQTVTQPVSVP